jgi:hypothetical protein
MLIKCSTCGRRIPPGWLFLGLPWSKHRCAQCGTVFSGTILRFVLVSISTGLLGYVLFGVIKGKTDPLLLPLPLVLTLTVLFLNLPWQLKKVDAPSETVDRDTP